MKSLSREQYQMTLRAPRTACHTEQLNKLFAARDEVLMVCRKHGVEIRDLFPIFRWKHPKSIFKGALR